MKFLPPPNPNKTESLRLGATSSLRAITEKVCSKNKDLMPKNVCVFNVMEAVDIKVASANFFDVQN